MNPLPHACFSAQSRIARWHAFPSVHHCPVTPHNWTFCATLVIRGRMVIEHNFSTVSRKISCCAFDFVQRSKTHLDLAFSHTQDITHFSQNGKRHDAVVQPIAYRVVHQDIFAHVHQPDVEDQTAEKARMPGPRSCEPNVRFYESGTNFMWDT